MQTIYFSETGKDFTFVHKPEANLQQKSIQCCELLRCAMLTRVLVHPTDSYAWCLAS